MAITLALRGFVRNMEQRNTKVVKASIFMNIVLKHNEVSEDADIVMCMEETHAHLHRLKE